jgi:lambda repressor-like predicted transcriptional regulator
MTDPRFNDVPEAARVPGPERKEWVAKKLREDHGLTMAGFARNLDVSRSSLINALESPSLRIEAEIAKMLNVDPRQLFSERYAANGARKHVVRAASDETACAA